MEKVKQKLKNIKMKDKIMIGVASLGIVIVVAILFVNNSTNKSVKLELRKEIITVEYGDDVKLTKLKASDVLSNKDENVLKSAKMEIKYKTNPAKETDQPIVKVGSYKGMITYKEEKINFTVNVEDRTKPVFKDFKDRIEVVREYNEDIAVNFVADDLSEVNISVDLKDVDLTKSGEYKANAIATDSHKNKETKEFTVVVGEKNQAELEAEKQVAEEPEHPEQQNQGGTSTNGGSTSNGSASSNNSSGSTGGGTQGGNAGGSSIGTGGGTSTPTPPAKVCSLPIGNSGQWFATEELAYNEGLRLMNDPNSGHFTQRYITWGDEICGYTFDWK